MEETHEVYVMSYYITKVTKPCCCLMCVELVISTAFCFTGSRVFFVLRKLRPEVLVFEN